MRNRTSSKSSLFLLEMMISILFFAIAASMCIQVFAKAHQFSARALNLNMAQSCASTAMELLAAGGLSEEEITDIFACANVQKDAFTVCYDKEWRMCEPSQAAFVLNAQAAKENNMNACHVLVETTDGEEIYSLTAEYYIPARKEGDSQ